jgi:LacI family transcriptional regulator
VAARAGVSRATVDRVLNRRGGVSVDKERCVLTSARELGLDRNLVALPMTALRVGVLMKPPQNPYYELLTHGFREANLLFAPQAITAYIHHVDILSPEAISARLEQISPAYDALVIVAPHRPSTMAILHAIGRRMPIITLATDLPLEAPHYYVGPDNVRAGRLAGELMGRLLGPAGGNVILVAGLSEFRGHDERRRGFCSILASDHPACRVSAVIETLDRNDLAASAVAQALAADRSIRGIYNISQGNDEIFAAIDQRRIPRDFTFICHDLTNTTRALLLARRIDVVIDQDPVLEARRAMESVLFHYGRWSGSAPEIRTPIRVYLREMLADD